MLSFFLLCNLSIKKIVYKRKNWIKEKRFITRAEHRQCLKLILTDVSCVRCEKWEWTQHSRVKVRVRGFDAVDIVQLNVIVRFENRLKGSTNEIRAFFRCPGGGEKWVRSLEWMTRVWGDEIFRGIKNLYAKLPSSLSFSAAHSHLIYENWASSIFPVIRWNPS